MDPESRDLGTTKFNTDRAMWPGDLFGHREENRGQNSFTKQVIIHCCLSPVIP